MFNSKKHILYFSQKTVQYAAANGSLQTRKIEREKEKPWTKETLAALLTDFKKNFGSDFSAVIDDDLAFTFGITIPADTKGERDFVRIKAAENVPEEIGEFGWDFKEVLESVDKKDKVVQFAALDSGFYKDISAAVRESGIKIEAIEPVSCSLARLLEERLEPILVIHKAARVLMFLCYRGLVFFTESFDDEPASEEIVKFSAFVKEKFVFTPKKVFLSGKFVTLNEKTFAFTGLGVEKGELDLFSGIAMKTDASRKDGKESLNIVLDAVVPAAAAEEDRLEKKIVGISEETKDSWAGKYKTIGADAENNLQGKFFTYVIFGLSLLILVLNGWILYQRDQVEKIINSISVVPPPAAAPQAANSIPASIAASSSAAGSTSSSVLVSSSSVAASSTASVPSPDLAVYNIEILNGSGVSGAAQTMQVILVKNGFTVAGTGNAGNFNYANTVISYKKVIPSSYRAALERVLSMGYTVSEGSPLSDTGKVDVKIIIGKN